MIRCAALLFIVMLGSIGNVNAQNTFSGAKNLPSKTRLAFQGKYKESSDINVTLLNHLIVISFKQGDDYKEAFYDKEGKWLRTESPIELDSLPKTVKKTLYNKEFEPWHKGSASIIESSSKKYKYKVYLYSSDWYELELLFDKKGNRVFDNIQ